MLEGLFNVRREDGRCYQYDIRTRSSLSVKGIREKEIVYGCKVLRKYGGEQMIDVRVYMGRSNSSSNVYAIIWLHGELNARGVGKAGGYGYNKKASAVCHALCDLGVASDVRDMADSGEITKALETMYKDIFDDDCIIVEFYA